MKTRFSVIVPLYNKAPYVKKALESIVAQTFADWECIIVDDGSTDNSADIAQSIIASLSETDHFIIRILRQPNSGVAAARNNGVKASRGEFVCFLDADDWWEPTWLEEMDRLIKEYPDAGLYATNYIYYKPGKTHVAQNLERGYIDYPKEYLHSEAMPVWTGAACMPRKVFDEMGGFPVGIKLGEDFLLWAKVALHYKVAFCENPIAYYNNDVPATLRATRNLHAPQYHKLFNLGEIEAIVDSGESIVNREEWKALLDKHRVEELMDYWLSDEYHEIATAELAKVDWSKQSSKTRSLYEKPIWLLKAKRKFMQIGSCCKLKLVRLVSLSI